MGYDPLGPGRRRHYRRQKLGPNLRCIGCGTSDPTLLIQAKRTLFEQHHPLGEAHVPELVVTVCRNCHALFSAGQVDDDVPLEPQPTVLERIVAIFEALVSFLRVLADILAVWIERGRKVVGGLDTDYAGWRAKPWAT
jgi:hypothetical protein